MMSAITPRAAVAGAATSAMDGAASTDAATPAAPTAK
jgi:hypothetical protein